MHPGGERYFIDTNVVLYAAGAPCEHKAACLAIMEALADRRLRGVTSTEVAVEVALHYIHHRRGDVAQFVLDRLAMAVEQILPVEFEDAQAMLGLVRQQPDFPVRDALHAAVMVRAGLTQIITVDKHFRMLDQVRTHSPAEVALALGL